MAGACHRGLRRQGPAGARELAGEERELQAPESQREREREHLPGRGEAGGGRRRPEGGVEGRQGEGRSRLAPDGWRSPPERCGGQRRADAPAPPLLATGTGTRTRANPERGRGGGEGAEEGPQRNSPASRSPQVGAGTPAPPSAHWLAGWRAPAAPPLFFYQNPSLLPFLFPERELLPGKPELLTLPALSCWRAR